MTYAFPWDPPSNDYWKSPTETASEAAFSPNESIQGRNTKTNLATAPDLTSLTNLVNSLNQTAQTSSNAGRIPNNPALEQRSSTNIGSLLKGQIPDDVTAQLAQKAAERGVAIGSPGSPNSSASLLRALGLTSLGLQQTGQQNLSAADARNPGAPIFDPSTQLLTPYQAGSLGLGQGGLSLDWLRALTQPTRSGSSGGSPAPQSTGTSSPLSNDNWWDSLFPSLNSTGNPVASGAPIYNPVGGSQYPGTSVPGLPDLGSILGASDANYNPAPANTVTNDTSSYYDPFLGYGDAFGGY